MDKIIYLMRRRVRLTYMDGQYFHRDAMYFRHLKINVTASVNVNINAALSHTGCGFAYCMQKSDGANVVELNA